MRILKTYNRYYYIVLCYVFLSNKLKLYFLGTVGTMHNGIVLAHLSRILNNTPNTLISMALI